MIQRLLLLSVVFFWLSSSSYSQDYTYDGQLSQSDIDQGTLYASPDDIGLMDEGLTYMDQIINNEVTPYTNGAGRDWQATTGCLNASTNNNGDGSWAGTSGGSCANIGTNGQGAIRFGYNTTVVAQTQSAIAEALKIAGITVVGYRYQWKVKNANANDTSGQQMNNQDPLIVTVTVKDKDGNVLNEREFDYSYYIANWQQKYGMYWYDPFISGDDIDTITLEVEGKDAGNWAGWWGPEFREAGIYSILVVEPPDPCEQIPIVDPTCPGFIGEAQSEDPAVKQLVIIASTGSIPLSEDELAVLESLEEEEEEIFEEEAVIESVEAEEEQNNVDALAVARNAESNALSDAANTIENTLSATALSVEQDLSSSLQINRQAQRQSQQSMNEAEETQQSSIAMADELNQSMLNSESSTTPEAITTTLDIASSGLDFNSDTTAQMDEINNSQTSSANQQSNQQQDTGQDGSEIDISSFIAEQQESTVEVELIIDSFEIAALDNALNDAVMNLIKMEQNIIREQVEESQEEEELDDPVSNEQEDELVAAALAGSDDEDAQAALLGFNPNFRAYQQPQMADADFYKPKDIYAGQENYDNPNARFFNGASDATHRKMIRQQYEGN